MDQREWGLLRETVVRRTQASGASREDAEDATHDALLAAIGQPQHPRSEVAWLSTVAQRRRVDLIRRRVREQRVPVAVSGGPDPTAAGPEDVVVDRAHASWLAASLTQLPPTTREVVDAVGAGMAPSEVARSMNLSARSVESHLTRARRHLRRMGALAVPVGVLLGWALRSRPGSRVAPAAMAVAIPMVVTAVALLPASTPMDGHPGGAPATALPGPAEAGPTPRGGLEAGSFAIEAIRPGPRSDGEQPALTGEQGGAAAPDLGVGQADDGAGPSRSDPTSPLPPPEGRTVPEQCGLELPVLDSLVCVLTDLAGGLTGGVVDGAAESPPEDTGRCPGGWGEPCGRGGR